MDRAQAFYETLLATQLRREAMGPQTLAVFPYDEAGVGGALLVHYMMWAQLESFTLQDSVWYLAMVIVGGLGSIEGTVFGVVFITVLKELVLVVGPMAQDRLKFLPIGAASGLMLVIVGSIAILFGVLEPRGMAHRWSLIKAFYRLWPFGY